MQLLGNIMLSPFLKRFRESQVLQYYKRGDHVRFFLKTLYYRERSIKVTSCQYAMQE